MTEDSAPKWAEKQLRLRKLMRDWIQDSIARWQHTPWGGGHDEAIFTRTWVLYYLLTGDESAYGFLKKMVHDLINSPAVEACKCFLLPEDAAKYPDENRRPPYHGYPEDQACFVHAPENYAWFLTHMAHISSDPLVRRALEDCAEHVGNWSEETPPWYDWKEHRFRSALFGTKKVRDYPPYDFETIALIRVMVLASNMFYLTGESRYLELCRDWADKWAKIVLECDPEEGFPPVNFPCPPEDIDRLYGPYASFRKERCKLDYELGNFLLDLFCYVREPRYQEAVRKMLEMESDWLRDGAGCAAIVGMLQAKYRAITGDTSFDRRVVELAESMLLNTEDNRTGILLMNKASERFLGTPGLIYVRIFRDGHIETDRRRTGMLTAAYLATGDLKYLEYAMELAESRFLDSGYIWDGRELGCRGSWQGRNGVAAHNVIPPMMCSAMGGFGMLEGERPWFVVNYSQDDERPGLPEGVAALLHPSDKQERHITIYNMNEEEVRLQVIAADMPVAKGEHRPPLACYKGWAPEDRCFRKVAVPAKSAIELKMRLA